MQDLLGKFERFVVMSSIAMSVVAVVSSAGPHSLNGFDLTEPYPSDGPKAAPENRLFSDPVHCQIRYSGTGPRGLLPGCDPESTLLCFR
jgi:hypothetical protein